MTLNDPYVTKHLCNLYVKYIVLPIGMTSNNIIFLCSPHYKDCLRTELGIDNSLCNPIYITTTLSKEEILDNHMSVLLLLGNFIQRLRTRYPFTLLDTSIKKCSVGFTSRCLQEGSCLIYVIFVFVCDCIVMSNTYCVEFLFCFSSSCVP